MNCFSAFLLHRSIFAQFDSNLLFGLPGFTSYYELFNPIGLGFLVRLALILINFLLFHLLSLFIFVLVFLNCCRLVFVGCFVLLIVRQ